MSDPDDPRLSPFRDLKDADLALRDGLFIVEGRLILRVLLGQNRWSPRCVLVSPAALESLRDLIDPQAGLASHPEVPVLLADQPLIERTAGFALHRGCVAAVARPRPADPGAILRALPPERGAVALLERVNNHDNVGSIFRSAAAFGLGAVLLTRGCVDPLYRKAVRVSMGGVLRVPWAFVDDAEALPLLRAHGFTAVALTPDPGAVDIRALGAERPQQRSVALMLGAEGPGLSEAMLKGADLRVRIPIVSDFDSLNVSVAAAIAMHHFAGHV